MTFNSPFNANVALQSDNKGSTYGKQEICWSSYYSFCQSTRGNRLSNSYRVEVLSSQVTLFSLQSESIIIANEPTRDPTITRDSEIRI